MTRRLFASMLGRIDVLPLPGIAKAATALKKTIPIIPWNGEVSEKAGSGSQGDGFSGSFPN